MGFLFGDLWKGEGAEEEERTERGLCGYCSAGWRRRSGRVPPTGSLTPACPRLEKAVGQVLGYSSFRISVMAEG